MSSASSTAPLLTGGPPSPVKHRKQLPALAAAVLVPLLLVAAARGPAAGQPAPDGPKELLGALTRARLIEAFPDWLSETNDYAPLWVPLERIRAVRVPVRIEVFLSTSAPESRTLAARLFKILDQAANPVVTTWYMGIPGPGKPAGLQAGARRVARTPAVIVYVQGREAGRIDGLPPSSLEEALAAMLPEPPPPSEQPEEDDFLYDYEFFRTTPHHDLNIDCSECHAPARGAWSGRAAPSGSRAMSP